MKRTRKKYERHGLTGTKVYYCYHDMISRCHKESSPDYKYYGARGIYVCKEWQESFIAFYEYVRKLEGFGNEDLWIDRINNDGPYAPGNVKWSTPKEQMSNRRMFGIQKPRGPWSDEVKEKIRQGNLRYQEKKRKGLL